MLYLLNYNMSVAVWVGLIALAGLDAETGVVMLLYLDQAWEKFKSQGRMNNIEDLYASVFEGAVQRIRPKIMTVCAIIFGLLPIMWSPVYQAGADVMKRIATPMVGGVITSAILELLIYPVTYVIWRKRALPRESPPSIGLPVSADAKKVPLHSRHPILTGSTLALLIGIVIAAAYFSWSSGFATSIVQSAHETLPVAKLTKGGVKISILSPDGNLYAKDNTLQIKFSDQWEHPIDAENVKLEANMDMPGMVMNSGATVKKDTIAAGAYQAHLSPSMAGDWNLILSYRGPQGPTQLAIPVNVK